MPLIDEMDAALFAGYTWRSWQDVHPAEQAFLIAHWRSRQLLDLHTQDAISRAQEAQQDS